MALAPRLSEPFSLAWPAAPAVLALSAGVTCVLGASLDLDSPGLARLAGILSPDELARAARFHFRQDHHRFVARRGLLRELLGSCLQIPPRNIAFSYGPNGKPYLTGPAAASNLQFSLAHSGATGVFVIGQQGELGIDVESIRTIPDLNELASTVLSSREHAAWGKLPASDRLRAFFESWTRKEALLKGTGQGLSIPPNEVEVSSFSGAPGEFLQVWESARDLHPWTLRSIAAANCALAVAFRNPPTRVSCWRWPSVSAL